MLSPNTQTLPREGNALLRGPKPKHPNPEMKNEPEDPTQRDEDKKLIARLAELQIRLGDPSDAKFSKRWLAGAHATTWLRLKDGTYAAEDWTPIMKRVALAVHAVEQFLETATLHGGLLKLSHVNSAITACRTAVKQLRDRLVVVLMPSGGGKTSIVPLLRLEFPEGVVACEATETWRDSYLAALMGIAEELKLEVKGTSARVVESAVLTELKERPRKLVIDEAHYLGQPTLNLVKAILNKTMSIVILLAIPELWKRISAKASPELAQLRARTCSRIEAKEMDSGDLEIFLAARILRWEEMPPEARKAAKSAVRAEGEKLGMWDTAFQMSSLVNSSSEGKVPAVEDFTEAAKDIAVIR